MRVIFLALLLANLLYMGWAEWIDVPPPPAPNPIAHLPQLKLASDVPPAQRPASANKLALETPVQPQCVSVGPFDDPATAAKALGVLQAESFAPKERTAESPAVRRLWVYLDGFKTDAGEMRVVHKLERAGIDDAEAMPAAGGGRRISLGLFTDRAQADARAQAVRRMGFNVSTAERTLPGAVYWLDLRLPSGSVPVPLKDVSDLQPAGATSSISVQACPATQAATAPASQMGSPSPPAAPATPAVNTASPPTSSSPVPALPECKPGGPVPCVAPEAKKSAHPSVL